MTEWKRIPGYEDHYEASHNGRIRSVERTRPFGRDYKTFPSQELKFSEDKDGYWKVGLTKEGKKKRFFVHRLIAMTFLSNPNNLPVVNHLDGDKKNVAASNLEWTTNSGNDLHAFRTGLRKMTDGGTSKKVLMVNANTGSTIKEYESMSEASRETGHSVARISYSANSEASTQEDFVWRFK